MQNLGYATAGEYIHITRVKRGILELDEICLFNRGSVTRETI